jgi:hypothetical protein
VAGHGVATPALWSWRCSWESSWQRWRPPWHCNSARHVLTCHRLACEHVGGWGTYRHKPLTPFLLNRAASSWTPGHLSWDLRNEAPGSHASSCHQTLKVSSQAAPSFCADTTRPQWHYRVHGHVACVLMATYPAQILYPLCCCCCCCCCYDGGGSQHCCRHRHSARWW